jgi:RHS repeat-associated protein
VLVQGWVYAGLAPVAELDGNNNVVSRFVYGTQGIAPEYLVKGGTTYRIVIDQRGSPRLIVNTSTGAIAQRIDYDEFGNILNDTNPGFQPFGFTGGLYDRDSGLVRLGARDYDSATGRWTAKDPILFGGNQANLYGYVGNDPINVIDALGLQPAGTAPDFSVLAGKEGWIPWENLSEKMQEALMRQVWWESFKQDAAALRRGLMALNTPAGRALRKALIERGTGPCPGLFWSRIASLLRFVQGIGPLLAIAPILPQAEQAAARVGEDFSNTPTGRQLNDALYQALTGAASNALNAFTGSSSGSK